MNDRELLEAAAKAAGLKVLAGFQAERDAAGHGDVGLWTSCTTCWNPLTDDGQALRLVVKLWFSVGTERGRTIVTGQTVQCIEDSIGGVQDIYQATRRAIVRAAAAMSPREPHNAVLTGPAR